MAPKGRDPATASPANTSKIAPDDRPGETQSPPMTTEPLTEPTADAEASGPLLDELRRANAHLELIRRLAMAANEVYTSRRVYQQAVTRVCQLTGWPVGHVYQRHQESGALVDSDVWHCDDLDTVQALVTATHHENFDPMDGLPGQVVEAGEPQWIRDVGRDPGFSRAADATRCGLRGALAFPVLVGDEVTAVLEFFSTEAADPDERFLELMADVGAILGRVVEREIWESELRRRESQLATAEKLARLGSWRWDPTNDRVTWSEQLYRIYGMEPGTPVDRDTYFALHHPDDRERVRGVIDRARETGTPFSVEHRIVRPDGEVRIVHGLGPVVLDEDGGLVQMAGTAQDVTERKEAEERERELLREHVREQLARARAEAEAEELSRLSNELQRSNAELDQFAYVASHDLKAPLRGIANLAQWLREDIEETLSEENREMLDLLSGRVHRMEALIDGLLSYSRAGRIREEPEAVDTGELVRDVVDLIDPPDDLELVVADGMPTLTTEKLPLQQVFHNLIANAVKYGPESGARIEVDREDIGDAWRFSVRDNGPGISPRYQERIWVMFQTLQPRDEVEGTGIGLALVKKIVGSRGGEVGLESEEGEGARFWFTWPAEPKPDPSPDPSQSGETPNETERGDAG
jgi:PAS domain S-box-containing protein